MLKCLPTSPVLQTMIYDVCLQVPGILTSLQKSVQAVLLGKAQLPDWFNNGVKTKSHSHKFNIANLKNSELRYYDELG